MIAIKGTYNQGKIDLEDIPPTSKANVIVVFTDLTESKTEAGAEEQARLLFNKFTGSIKRTIDYEAEKLEAIDEKYNSFN